MNITKILWEHADYCLRVSLYIIGKKMQTGFGGLFINEEDERALLDMENECEPTELWAKKSCAYHWGPYEYNEPSEVTMLEDKSYLFTRRLDGGSDGLTRWLYDHVLKYFNVNPSKGLNGDQMRAYFTVIYANNDIDAARRIWKHFKYRLFMYPSLMENCLLKPQAMFLLFKMLQNDSLFLKLMYKISKKAFELSIKSNFKEPIEVSTTNKISLLPTMKLCGYEMPSDPYIKDVYTTYWPCGEDGNLIRKSLIKGLTGKDEEDIDFLN